MKLATLEYHPNKFKAIGPPELVFSLQKLLDNPAYDDPTRYAAMLKLFTGFYVICGISGEQIPLDMLSYWNLDQQMPFKGPAEVAENVKRKGGYK